MARPPSSKPSLTKARAMASNWRQSPPSVATTTDVILLQMRVVELETENRLLKEDKQRYQDSAYQILDLANSRCDKRLLQELEHEKARCAILIQQRDEALRSSWKHALQDEMAQGPDANKATAPDTSQMQTQAGNPQHIPSGDSVGMPSDECQIATPTRTGPRYRPREVRDNEHNRLAGMATFIEDMETEEDRETFWTTESLRNPGRSPEDWRAYYEQVIRPKYLINRANISKQHSEEDTVAGCNGIPLDTEEDLLGEGSACAQPDLPHLLDEDYIDSFTTQYSNHEDTPPHSEDESAQSLKENGKSKLVDNQDESQTARTTGNPGAVYGQDTQDRSAPPYRGEGNGRLVERDDLGHHEPAAYSHRAVNNREDEFPGSSQSADNQDGSFSGFSQTAYNQGDGFPPSSKTTVHQGDGFPSSSKTAYDQDGGFPGPSKHASNHDDVIPGPSKPPHTSSSRRTFDPLAPGFEPRPIQDRGFGRPSHYGPSGRRGKEFWYNSEEKNPVFPLHESNPRQKNAVLLLGIPPGTLLVDILEHVAGGALLFVSLLKTADMKTTPRMAGDTVLIIFRETVIAKQYYDFRRIKPLILEDVQAKKKVVIAVDHIHTNTCPIYFDRLTWPGMDSLQSNNLTVDLTRKIYVLYEERVAPRHVLSAKQIVDYIDFSAGCLQRSGYRGRINPPLKFWDMGGVVFIEFGSIRDALSAKVLLEKDWITGAPGVVAGFGRDDCERDFDEL